MENMRVIFSRNVTWWDIFTPLVRLVTWSPWSHCALLFDDGTVIQSTALGKGVHTSTFEGFKNNATTWKVQNFKVDSQEAIRKAAEAQLGKPYNWTALIGMLLHIGSWKGKGSWFCSELVAEAFATGGTPLFNLEFEARIAPQHLWMLPSENVMSS